jgi:hypothetical protein
MLRSVVCGLSHGDAEGLLERPGPSVVLTEHWLIDVVPATVGTVGVGLLAESMLGTGSARPGPVAAESTRL